MRKKMPIETAKFILSDSDILAMIAHTKAIISGYYIADGKKTLLSIVIWGACAFVVYNLKILYRSSLVPFSNFVDLFIIFFILLSTLTLKKYLNARAEVKSYIDDEGWYKLEQIVTVSDKSIKIKNDFVSSEYTWDSFASFIEDDSRALLGAGVGPCIVIPKDAGISNERIDWIRQNLLARSENM